jgi:oligopeptide/dipeptide ABC transporter ATP-binding protein
LSDGRVARAVDGVSFDIKRGESVALVGESGCGKSVTAFSIMQLLPRSAIHPSGSILFEGQDVLKMTVDERREMRGNQASMIFQEPGTSLNPVFTVGYQVAEALRLHQQLNRADARARVIEMFGEVGIPNPAERYAAFPHELSGGMKQRVMIAMALACRPDLLIADEPTTALDVTIQAQILKLIQDLQRERQMAVLMITHNLRVVNQVADRVIVMYAGKMVEKAERTTLFKNPQHPYTRKLLRSIPGEEVRGQPLEEIPGRVPPATEFPSHCRFADRCEKCFDACRESDPPLVEVGPDHEAACMLFKERTVQV